MINQLGGFWLGTRLGSGGNVYDAYDESGVRHALRLLPSPPDPGTLTAWTAAIRRVSSLRVARLVACCPDSDPPYLVSEYVEGISLRAIVARHGPFTDDDLWRLAATTATALAAVHEAGVAHGGLTPGRVLIGPDGPRLAGPRLRLPGDGLPGDGPPDDVRAWGRLLHYAAYGPRPDRPPTPRPDLTRYGPHPASSQHPEPDRHPNPSLHPEHGPHPDPSQHPEHGPSQHPEYDRRPDLSQHPDRRPDTLARPDGRTSRGAAGGVGRRPPLDGRLRELIISALHVDPAHRPGARQLLLSLLDAPQSQQGRLLPPDPVDDPPLGARAEALYLQLPLADQALVPEVFLRLVGVSGPGTRRSATRAELLSGRAPEQAAALERVLKAYGEAGFLTGMPSGVPNEMPSAMADGMPSGVLDEMPGGMPSGVLDGIPAVIPGRDAGPGCPAEIPDGMSAGGAAVTIAQAALLVAWPRLREWLDAERGGLAAHRELAGAARRWEAGGRRDGDLFGDGPLDRSLGWAAGGRRHLTLTATEQAFLDACRALARRRGRRRRAVTAGLVAVTLAGALAWQDAAADGRLEGAMAKVAASRADAVRLADPVTASKLGLAAWSLAPVAQARTALERSAADPAVAVFAAPHAGDRSLHALSADGSRLASLADGTIRVYEVARREEVARAPAPAQSVRAMAWSPDGRTLALVGVDRSYLWDPGGNAHARTDAGTDAGTETDAGREIDAGRDAGTAIGGETGSGVGPPFGRGLGAPGEQAAWFSPGGTLLFAAARQSGERWAWDLRSRRATLLGEYAVAGPRDQMALIFAGRRSHLRYLGTGATTERPWLERMPWEYTTFAPDGERVAIAEEDGVQIYRLDGVPTLPVRLQPSPGRLRFSFDGRILTSTGSDRVRAWRIADGALLIDRAVPATGTDQPAQAAVSADDRWLRVLAGRGTVLTIDLARAGTPRDPARSAADVCARHGGLSRAEWGRHLPELPYRELCD